MRGTAGRSVPERQAYLDDWFDSKSESETTL
jgi:hypothetical protein